MSDHLTPAPGASDSPADLRQRRGHPDGRGTLAAILTMDACTLGACGAGWLLDQKLGTFPFCLAALGVVSVIAGMAMVLKSAVREGAPSSGTEEGPLGHD